MFNVRDMLIIELYQTDRVNHVDLVSLYFSTGFTGSTVEGRSTMERKGHCEEVFRLDFMSFLG